MDREAAMSQAKVLKDKARAARKAGKKQLAKAFKQGSKRLRRKLRATAPKTTAKKDEAAAS